MKLGDDEYWNVGIRITVDRAPRSYPKMHFNVLLRFVLLEDRKLTLGFEHKEFTFRLDDPEGTKSAFEYIVDLVHRVFNTLPGRLAEKTPIGFTPPRTES